MQARCREQEIAIKTAKTTLASVLPVSDGVITVRPMEHRDAEAYAIGTEDRDVKQHAHLPLDRYTADIVRDMVDGVLAEGLRDGTLAVLTIADAKSNAFAGSLVLFDLTPSDAEVGYWVAPEHRGRGIAGRAVALAGRIGRELGFSQLRARTALENPPSERVLLAAGFARAGEPDIDTAPSGKSVTTVPYRIDLEA